MSYKLNFNFYKKIRFSKILKYIYSIWLKYQMKYHTLIIMTSYTLPSNFAFQIQKIFGKTGQSSYLTTFAKQEIETSMKNSGLRRSVEQQSDNLESIVSRLANIILYNHDSVKYLYDIRQYFKESSNDYTIIYENIIGSLIEIVEKEIDLYNASAIKTPVDDEINKNNISVDSNDNMSNMPFYKRYYLQFREFLDCIEH